MMGRIATREEWLKARKALLAAETVLAALREVPGIHSRPWNASQGDQSVFCYLYHRGVHFYTGGNRASSTSAPH